jgi:hypothetical protein
MNAEENLFVETAAAAKSLKNFWTRLASTYGCMQVRLTRQQLIIEPRWFIGWLIKILGLDLYHVAPINQIQAAESRGNWCNYGKVEIKFSNDGNDHKILLYLKQHDEFINKAIQVIKTNKT